VSVDPYTIAWDSIPWWNANPSMKGNISGWTGYDDARSGGQYLFWEADDGGRMRMKNTTGSAKSECWQNVGRLSPGDIVFMRIVARCSPGRLKEAQTYMQDNEKVSGVHVGYDIRLDDFTMVHEINTFHVESDAEYEAKELIWIVPETGTFWNPAKKDIDHAAVPPNSRAVFHISMYPTGARDYILVKEAGTKIFRASAIPPVVKPTDAQLLAFLGGLYLASEAFFK